MSKLYVFGIGGTGSRVLRSLTMMLAAGVKTSQSDVVPIVIDPDSANADLTRTVALMNKYANLRQHLTFPEKGQGTFFKAKIDQILPNYNLLIKDTEDRQFQQFIELPAMNKQNHAMMRMLFSEKNLASSMNVGFKGNPNIGSVVLNQIVNSEDFITFANSFEKGDKIFIVSSIFGGTGASGFPLLLKTLRTGDTFPNNDMINKAEIGAVTILPYFKLEQSEDSEIDSSTFISKAKSALAYYENNISKNNQINALYFLADNMSNTYANHEGGTQQRNSAHLIEFLAASAAFDFANKHHEGPAVNKELGLKDNHRTIHMDSFYDELTAMLRMPLTQFMLMSNCVHDKFDFISKKNLAANNGNFDEAFYNAPFMQNLKSFLDDYRLWLSEMKDNKRSLDLFNFDCGDEPFNVVVGQKPKSLFTMLSNYNLFYDRLNNAVKKAKGDKESRWLETYSIATAQLAKEKFGF
ncbi:MAG: hypothetical protein IJ891_11335 [Prevotella sp.]|nr:hypothetical protein [Prevotella sp.]